MTHSLERDNDVIAALRESKANFAARLRSDALHQTGPLVLDQELIVPDPPLALVHRLAVGIEPVIDMFVASAAGSLTAMGSDDELNAFWEPTVSALTSAVLGALQERRVQVDGDVYITASLTAPGAVIGDPHLDDDQFRPAEGVGVAAIVSNNSGPRFAAAPVPCAPLRPGLPVQVSEAAILDFGENPLIETGPNRPVIFPQFGQLHAGPRRGATTTVRSLFVVRAATKPAL